MVTRNFLEVDSNVLFPRIDDNQGGTGIVGMEFPILNYIHFLFAKLFGYYSWHGRLINLIMSSIGILFFCRILKQFFNSKTALFSSIALLTSSWFMFSRKMMPDTFCISLIIIGMYYGVRYIRDNNKWHLVLYILISTLGVLSKIPALVYLLLFLIIIPFWKSQNIKRKYLILTFSIIPIVSCFLWYFIWNPYLAETYGNWYNIGQTFNSGFNELKSNLIVSLRRFYFYSFRSYTYFILSLVGFCYMIIEKNKVALTISAIGSFIFFGYIVKSGFYFHHHSYYILPFVPIMSLAVGYGLSNLRHSKYALLVLLISVVESVSNQQHDLFIRESELYKTKLEGILDQFSNSNDLIAINGNNNPQQIYFSHRKGWTIDDSQISDLAYINSIKEKGCRYLIINKNYSDLRRDQSIIYSDNNYIIYSLEE